MQRLLLPPPRLRAKPVRTASGIAVVAVMSKPHRCPHIATTGNICVYCPGGPDSDFEYSTQSYTGAQPSSCTVLDLFQLPGPGQLLPAGVSVQALTSWPHVLLCALAPPGCRLRAHLDARHPRPLQPIRPGGLQRCRLPCWLWN